MVRLNWTKVIPRSFDKQKQYIMIAMYNVICVNNALKKGIILQRLSSECPITRKSSAGMAHSSITLRTAKTSENEYIFKAAQTYPMAMITTLTQIICMASR
jgi:hypothetical protein